jgi:DNA-binding transcriptional LysR family regulator
MKHDIPSSRRLTPLAAEEVLPKRTGRIVTSSEQRVQGVQAPDTDVGGFDLRTVDWDDLRLFLRVVGRGSLRSVAQEESVTVNTVRARIERLESNLGRTLVRRTTKGVSITDAGAALVEASRAMDDAARRGGRDGSQDVLVRPGEITIGCSEGLGTLWLTPRITALQAKLPELTVGLHFDYDLARDRASECDLWLTFEQPTRADLIVAKLATLHFLPFASEGYLREYGCPDTVDDLKNHKIVEHAGPGVRSELLDYLIGSGREPGQIAMRTNSSLSQLWAVAEGAGIGGLPTFVRDITAAVVPVPLMLNIRRELRLVYRADARTSPAVREVIRWLRDAFDSRRHPCFADNFVHPDQFTNEPAGGNVVRLFCSVFDRIE